MHLHIEKIFENGRRKDAVKCPFSRDTSTGKQTVESLSSALFGRVVWEVLVLLPDS
jgi:hypothetical protein